jgi:hypothetical protein
MWCLLSVIVNVLVDYLGERLLRAIMEQ